MKNFTFFLITLLVIITTSVTMAQSPWFLQRANGLSNSVNPAVVFSAVDENVCWGINYENSQFIRTSDGGTNWTVSTITGAAGLNGSCISALDANNAFAAMNDPSNATSGGVFKTTDGGSSWVKQTSAFPGSGGQPSDIHFFDSNNGVVIGNPHSGTWEIFTTTNGGSQWVQVPAANIPPPVVTEFTPNAFYASAGNSIWFGSVAGAHFIYRSTDRGFTWARSNVPGDVTFCVAFKDSLNGLSCFPFNASNQISKTTNGGVTWASLPNVPSTPSAAFISYAKGTTGSYLITSSTNIGNPVPTIPGSIFTSDDGETWSAVMDNVPHGLTSFSDDGWGWSGGINDSIYKIYKDSLTIVSVESENNNSLVEQYNLGQNYPNPFNPSTTIKYSIPTSEFVTLKVYSVLGNEVATLVNEEKPAGSYELNFNSHSDGGQNLSSGIYFYTLQAGSYTQTKKLILMK